MDIDGESDDEEDDDTRGDMSLDENVNAVGNKSDGETVANKNKPKEEGYGEK